jgi:hypothetical protein
MGSAFLPETAKTGVSTKAEAKTATAAAENFISLMKK